MIKINNKHKSAAQSISKQLLIRLPNYLLFLKTIDDDNLEFISAPTIAQELGLNEVQVRKDLSTVSSTGGRPKTGFAIKELISDLEHFLGYDNVDEAVLVGVGHLGKAFLSYKGFEKYGLKILAAFDNDETIVGSEFCGKKIMHVNKITEFCQRVKAHIGIITVPAESAQEVCDQLIGGGILAILNFAPIHLNAPEYVFVKNVNIAASLADLSRQLAQKISTDQNKEI